MRGRLKPAMDYLVERYQQGEQIVIVSRQAPRLKELWDEQGTQPATQVTSPATAAEAAALQVTRVVAQATPDPLSSAASMPPAETTAAQVTQVKLTPYVLVFIEGSLSEGWAYLSGAG